MKEDIEKIIKNGIVEQYSNSEWVTRLINSIYDYIEENYTPRSLKENNG